jgi:hypothetical protein
MSQLKMLINDPTTVAELEQLYPLYESALVNNDVDTLTRMFWAAPQVMRFGVTENLYGIEQLNVFRQNRSAAGLARTVSRLDIVAFGTDTGSITLEFERTTPDGKTVRGRQSQMWIRLPEGWRIVAAHVSLLPQPAPAIEKA